MNSIFCLYFFLKYKNKSAHCWLLMLHTCLCLQLEAQSTSAFVPSVLYEFLHVSLCEPGRRVENKTFIAEAVVFVSLLSLRRKCFSVHSSLRCLHRTECVFFLYASVLRGYLVWLYDFSSSTLLQDAKEEAETSNVIFWQHIDRDERLFILVAFGWSVFEWTFWSVCLLQCV